MAYDFFDLKLLQPEVYKSDIFIFVSADREAILIMRYDAVRSSILRLPTRKIKTRFLKIVFEVK